MSRAREWFGRQLARLGAYLAWRGMELVDDDAFNLLVVKTRRRVEQEDGARRQLFEALARGPAPRGHQRMFECPCPNCAAKRKRAAERRPN